MHLAASLENKTLRRISNFSFHPALRFLSIPGLLDAIGTFADEEVAGIKEDKFVAVGIDFAIVFGAAYQAGVLRAASGAETAHVEQMKKIVPFVTCEIAFGQHVCELMVGVDVPDT